MAQPPSAASAPVTARRLGRFELQRQLGRGAQATVWLAHDPHLQRHVALKLLNENGQAGAAEGTAQHWLHEARTLSRLSHPHVVTLFEAGRFDGRTCLVLEWVDGPSLAQRLKAGGAFSAADAVNLMVGVLDALGAAHALGVVHRDLKPANILLDPAGQPKVTDFGLAARLAAAGATANSTSPGAARGAATRLEVEGSPAYLSPEAARGESPQPVQDVFSAGLVLAELLTGRPLIQETDPYRAIYRLAHEDLTLPRDPDHPVDDALRAVVQRALARDPSRRYASAQDLRDALLAWRSVPQTDDASASGGTHATLDFLLLRMRRTSDFPAMSEQILRVQSLAASETESLNGLTSEILKDVALTNKLLRVVNSAHFSHVGAGHINTVSRAVSLIGFSAIRNLAMSLVMLDHMENKAHANQLKGEFLRALLAASMASDIAGPGREHEEVFIGGLFQNLGRMLTEFYFPDEAQQIRVATQGAQAPTEAAASQAVLGISYEALGQGIGKAWSLPATLLRLMRKPTTAPPSRPPKDSEERLHWAALAANELADVFLHAPEHQLAAQLHKTAARYAAAVGHGSDALAALATAARDRLGSTAEAIGIRVSAQSAAARLVRPASAAAAAPKDSVLGGLELTAAEAEQAGAPDTPGRPADEVASLLAQGIQDVTQAMMEQVKLNDLLRMILEAMYRAMGLRQVVFCMKDPRSGLMQGRLGLGQGASATAAQFRFDVNEPRNLFAAVCSKGLDTLIQDASDPKVVRNLPPWFEQHVQGRSFVLLPLQVKQAPFGLIYADQAHPNGVTLDAKGLALLKTLRNQAVMAFRQSREG